MSTPRLVLAALAFLCPVGSVGGEDHFLVIGGGYAPPGNQVSLEKNVLLFRTMLGEFYPSGAAADVFFSDGDDPGRDVQYREPEADLPRVNVLLARILGQTEALGESYRSHAIPEIRGASRVGNLRRWFHTTGSELRPGDRLVVYVTAHGGKGSEDEPRNTVLYLWDREPLRVRELAGLIDELPEGVRVVLVMVQCYSGGFAELAFAGGDRANGPSRADICGFFATTHDRPAAGCTPDIDEEQYHEYSSYFWEALRGKTRTGIPVGRDPDLDGDGLVSFAEAHAYALIESVTVDISVKTSDAFLRHASRTSADPGEGLLSADSPCELLLGVASTTDRAVIVGLSETLGLSGPDRAAEARRRADATSDEARRLDRSIRMARARADADAGRIRLALLGRWPELENRWNPIVAELLTSEAVAVIDLIESHPSYDEFERHRTRLAALRERRLDQDRIGVRCERLVRTLENVALEVNLPRVADPPTVERYRRLVSAESATLGVRPAANSAALATPPR